MALTLLKFGTGQAALERADRPVGPFHVDSHRIGGNGGNGDT
jgi:hypothetical protein